MAPIIFRIGSLVVIAEVFLLRDVLAEFLQSFDEMGAFIFAQHWREVLHAPGVIGPITFTGKGLFWSRIPGRRVTGF